MSAPKGTNQDQPESRLRTLGRLLYPDKTKRHVSEDEWVRLVQAIAAGDQVALHSLFEQSHRIVFTLIVRITSNHETAEELTVDVFHDVWRRAPLYDPAGGSVVGWIMNQARCRAIDRLRFEQRKKRVNTNGDDPPGTTAAHDPHQALHIEEQNRLLRNALDILSPEERQVIETAFFSELTYQEAATKLNQPLGTFKTRVRSGLGKLRKVLATTLKKSV